MSTNIITDFQINNNLTITDNNLKIQTDGTTNTLDISGNVDVSSNLIIRGYIGIKTETPVVSIDISANDALRLPVGNNSSRPDYTAIDCSGCIRYNSETTQFEGFSPSGLSWIGLGGVVNIAQTTYITAEETTGENKLRFYTAGGQQMLINDDGNIGIGLALGNDPAYILDINSTGAIRIPIGTTSERDDITNTAGLIRYNSSNNEFEGYSTAWGGLGGVKTPTGNTKITADDTNGLEFFTSNDEKMTILANGNVGIGTTSPGAPLHLSYTNGAYNGTQGFINEATSGRSTTRLRTTTDFASELFFDVNGAIRWDFSCRPHGNDYNMYFYNSPNATSLTSLGSGFTPVMVLTQTGNVGIGTTSPGEKLEVDGNIICNSIIPKTGNNNIMGTEAGNNITTGTYNNILGYQVAYNLTTGTHNNIMGYRAAYAGIMTGSGDNNIMGREAGYSVTSGTHGIFLGYRAGYNVQSGKYNIAIGGNSGPTQNREYTICIGASAAVTDNFCIAIGSGARGADHNTIAMGQQANADGAYSIAIGASSGTNDSTKTNTICIGQGTTVTGSNMCRIGNDDIKVGIGTDEPTAKLEIKQAPSTDANTSPFLRLMPTDIPTHDPKEYVGLFMGTSTTSNYGFSLSAIKTDSLAANMALDIRCHNNSSSGTSRLLIDKDGNVGIGNTAPVEKLHVTGNTVVTGDITAYYSDERLKTFKGKITEPLAKIKQLNGYYFVENELAKSLGYDNDKLQVGVSAQEVEKVLPEIVTKAPIDHKYKTVWYQKLTPLLIEGMKEQQTQIEQQQTQIQSLQEQINELKALISK